MFSLRENGEPTDTPEKKGDAMRMALVSTVGIGLALGATACGGSAATTGGGTATVVLADKVFNVSNVQFSYQIGDGGYFRLEGDDAANPEADCVPGLSGGLQLYGDLPATVTSLSDLVGQDLPFEFTGDGDEANLCFRGSNGLLGVESGTVQFTAVEPASVTFAFSGTFGVYDGVGGREPSDVSASGNGIATIITN